MYVVVHVGRVNPVVKLAAVAVSLFKKPLNVGVITGIGLPKVTIEEEAVTVNEALAIVKTPKAYVIV